MGAAGILGEGGLLRRLRAKGSRGWALRRHGRAAAPAGTAPPDASSLLAGDWPDERGLPPFCGAVASPDAEVLVIGVTHRDGGVSSRAVRRLVEGFAPDVCVVELDDLRFARLVAENRSLPWPFQPARKFQQQSGPLRTLFFQTLRLGYQGWNAAVGAAGVSEEFGTEFFEAFQAAEARGALVVPGDLPVISMFRGVGDALRAGASNPIGLQVDGIRTILRATGGLGERPRLQGQPGAVGIALGAALSSEGGGRTAPLLKVAALGAGLLLLVSLLVGDPTAETLEEVQALDSMDALEPFFALRAFLELASVLAGGVLLGAYATAVLRDRDEVMVEQMAGALSLAAQLRKGREGPASRGGPRSGTEGASGAAAGGPLRCRWLKRTWPANMGDEAQAALRRAEDAAAAGGDGPPLAGERLDGVLALEGRPRPQYEGESGWLPLLELRGPLAEGETLELSLFEPRFLELMEVLELARPGGAGLTLGALHVLAGSQRPLAVDPRTVAGRGPTLRVEEEAVLGEAAHLVEVLESREEHLEDTSPPRRWRVRVRGTGRRLPLHEGGLAADEAGVLWAAPAEEPLAAGPAPPSAGAAVAGSGARGGGGGAVRCVAVVGLLHVNGVVSGMQRALRDESTREET